MINKPKGYTLIELTVVIFLIGTMLAITVPRIQDSFLSDDLKTSTRRFIGKVRALREKAIRNGSDYELHLDIVSNQFWDKRSSPSSAETEEQTEAPEDSKAEILILDVDFPDSGKKDVGEAIIHFTKKGYVEPAIVHLGTKADHAHTIVLSPFLGIQKTYDKYVDLETLAANDM